MTPVISESAPVFVGDALVSGPIDLDLCSEAHFVVTGQTRSGKSVWFYSFLSQLAMMPHVRVVGVDFTDILLRPFRRRGFSDPWICTDGDDIPQTLRFMEDLKAEMDRRNRLLSGSIADKWDTFSPGFPLIVAVFEEFPGIISRCKLHDQAETDRKAPKMAPRFQALLSSLVAESAKAGIRIVLIAQRADAEIIGGAARENLPVRIAFKTGGSEAYRMLFPDIEAHEIESVKGQPPGVGVIETPRLTRRIFKGPFVTYEKFVRHVESCDLNYLRDLAIDKKFRERVAEEFPGIGDPG